MGKWSEQNNHWNKMVREAFICFVIDIKGALQSPMANLPSEGSKKIYFSLSNTNLILIYLNLICTAGLNCLHCFQRGFGMWEQHSIQELQSSCSQTCPEEEKEGIYSASPCCRGNSTGEGIQVCFALVSASVPVLHSRLWE